MSSAKYFAQQFLALIRQGLGSQQIQYWGKFWNRKESKMFLIR